MIKPTDRRIILEPTRHAFESAGTINPATYYEDGLTHLFYRAVRRGNYSSIGYAVLRGTDVIYRSPRPILSPTASWERHGMEDPRIVRLKDRFYLFYTAYDGEDAQVAYATADELPLFTKRHIVSPPFAFGEIRKASHLAEKFPEASSMPGNDLLWDKDAFIFPEYINGKLAMLHRLAPNIQILYFNSFEQLRRTYWNRYIAHLDSHVVLRRRFPFENDIIGGGVPPILTEAGWLLIYHAVQREDGVRTYRAGAALLETDDPLHVIGRLPYPLFGPEEPWELSGTVNRVVFPSGATVLGDDLHVYYGAADTRIGRVTFRLPKLLEELISNPPS